MKHSVVATHRCGRHGRSSGNQAPPELVPVLYEDDESYDAGARILYVLP